MPRQATHPFEALADPHRRVILELLHGGPRSVREIADDLPITRPPSPGTSACLRKLGS